MPHRQSYREINSTHFICLVWATKVLRGCFNANPTLTRNAKYALVYETHKDECLTCTGRNREFAFYESTTQRERVMSSTIDLVHTKSEPIQIKSLHRSDEVVHNSTLSHRLRSRTDSRQASLMVTDR
jgi:hypothetical protein